MKRACAILFSLLLIVTQTIAVAVPMGSRQSETKPCCCDGCVQCVCCVDKNSDAAPAENSLPPVRLIHQFVFVPSAQVLFEISPAYKASAPSAPDVSLIAVRPPIFERNCTFLI